ncbi:hypothetical protein [Plantactinospora sonchi]|uniref:Anti-sigma-D factor RsdA sigma factor binding region domain-containing protein n=1 Tax=Plantactinospora sonchi TaxID=1544735 RepID=A0ABU7S137_9ACTN
MSTVESGAERDGGVRGRDDDVSERQPGSAGAGSAPGDRTAAPVAPRGAEPPDMSGSAVGPSGLLAGPSDVLVDPSVVSADRRDTEPLDPRVIDADDLLLDALGRGEPGPDDDPVAGLLAAWHAELDTDRPAETAEIRPAPDRTRRPERRPGVTAPGRRRSGRLRERAGGPLPRRLAFSTAAAVVVVALLGLGVNRAGPTSPLWPITSAVYPDRSAVRAVEHTLGLAEDAVATRRYDDARRHLEQALGQVAAVRDPVEERRLRADIDRIRGGLPVNAEPDPTPATPAVPSPGPVPTDPSTGRPGKPTGTPGGGSPAPRPSRSAPVPTAPAPPRVLPLPVPVLPTLLPSGLPLLPSGGCVLLCPPG